MPFFRSPFVYLTSSLILGLLLFFWTQDLISINLLLAITAAPVFISLLIFRKNDQWRVVPYCLLMLFLGVVVNYLSQPIHQLSEGEQSMLLKITEFENSDKVWKKGIGERCEYKGQTLKNTFEKVLIYSEDNLNVNSIIIADVEVDKIANKNNPGEFDAESFWKSKGITHFAFVNSDTYLVMDQGELNWFQKTISSIRSYSTNQIKSHFDEQSAAVLNAIVLGDKSLLSSEVRSSFSNAGVMHVLAVSGLHVGIVMLLLIFIFEKGMPRIGRKNALWIVLVLTWFYAALTGFSPSVVRATIMFSCIFGAQLFNRQPNNINILFFSAFLMLVIRPNFLFDIGFQLSYLAMLGIFLFYKPVSALYSINNKWLRKIWEGTAVGIAAQIMTVPLTLYYFHQFPNYFVFSNVGMMVFAGLVLGLGLGFLIFGKIPGFSFVLKFILALIVFAMLQFIFFIDALPGSVAYGFNLSISVVLIFYLLIGAILIFQKSIRMRMILGVGVMILLAFVQWGRYTNMSQNHLVIFNNNDPFIALKKDNKTYCFYTERCKLKNVNRLLDDYFKIYPSERVNYVLIKGSNKLTSNDDVLTIDLLKDRINIKRNQHSIQLATRYILPDETCDFQLAMPYLKVEDIYQSLREGAVLLND